MPVFNQPYYPHGRDDHHTVSVYCRIERHQVFHFNLHPVTLRYIQKRAWVLIVDENHVPLIPIWSASSPCQLQLEMRGTSKSPGWKGKTYCRQKSEHCEDKSDNDSDRKRRITGSGETRQTSFTLYAGAWEIPAPFCTQLLHAAPTRGSPSFPASGTV